MDIRVAKFHIGQVVRHRVHPFRGVIIDVDPVYGNTEEWYEAIPESLRPSRDQPFYHLLAESGETTYTAYVSEQNLLAEDDPRPLSHPSLGDFFDTVEGGLYVNRTRRTH
ncbi:heat shock protein HspQ [Pararhodospirillum oryzae]|uniref:Heat shock protein HspQ n=1 Tax=Pararhodospirillum oryzae TaxID=478448 RepID=A0A512H548_9PROT|nr:heat shock protein HspQ [Pararhodospirillum oryzae]GEO80592.1 DNA-binding protein [Pararhodospirillum oryzae]